MKAKKEELFLQLKKVLNEDEMKKTQSEKERLAVQQALASQSSSQNNQQYDQLLMNQSLVNNSRLQINNQSQLNTLQQQQLLSKHSPITTNTNNLSTQSNYLNITQSLPQAHQQQPQQLTNKRTSNLKRPLERTSPQPNNNNYNGVPNYGKIPALSSHTPVSSKLHLISFLIF